MAADAVSQVTHTASGDEDRLHGVGERGEAIGKFVPLVEVAAVDGIAVGDAFTSALKPTEKRPWLWPIWTARVSG